MTTTNLERGATRGEVLLDDLILDRAYQVRAKLDLPTVTRYVDVKKAGGELPPIQVMVVDGAPTLVDGWHRVEAARKLGETSIVAEITHGTEADLIWAAAEANLKHGLQLKRAELRNVLRAYVEAGKHLARGRKPKSARDIGREIGGVSHATVLSWLKADLPHVHRAIANGSLEGKPTKAGGLHDLQRRREDEAMKALAQAAALIRGVSSARRRAQFIAQLENMVEQIKADAPWSPAPVSNEW